MIFLVILGFWFTCYEFFFGCHTIMTFCPFYLRPRIRPFVCIATNYTIMAEHIWVHLSFEKTRTLVAWSQNLALMWYVALGMMYQPKNRILYLIMSCLMEMEVGHHLDKSIFLDLPLQR